MCVRFHVTAGSKRGGARACVKYYRMYLAMKNKRNKCEKHFIKILKDVGMTKNAKKYRNKMQYMQAKPVMMA